MNRGAGLVLLLMLCSPAIAQEGLLHPRANAPALSSQSPRPTAPSMAIPEGARPESSEQAITPRRDSASPDRALVPKSGSSSPWRMLGALLLAVGGIVGVAKLLKSLGVGPLAARPLPGSLCEVLGVTQLPQRHTLYLLRLGQRILLLGSTGEHLTVLSETTDPEEVASMVKLSQSASDLPDAQSFFSRLLSHQCSAKTTNDPSASTESSARRELEAKLNAFAQS